MKLIKYLDFYGKKIKLNIKDSARYKTLLEGILSIISIMIISSAVIYFTQEFFYRDDSTTITNIVATNEVIVDFMKIPFIIRISDIYSRVLKSRRKFGV
jgi:hypothetical protein